MSNGITHIGPFRLAPHVRSGQLTGQWLVDVPKKMLGRRKRKFFDDRAQAEKYARELDRRYRSGEWGRVRHDPSLSKERRATSLLLEDAVSNWTEFQQSRVETRKKRRVSLETDRMRLKASLAFFGNVELSAITEEKLAKFQAYRLHVQKRKAATIKSDLIALGKVLRWALKNGHIHRLPEIEHIPEDPPETLIPTKEEIARLIEALPPDRRLLVRFLAETGCRSGEAFNLTWDCIDLESGAVEIRTKDGWTPKTRSSQRRFYIRGGLLEHLRASPKDGRYVFAGRDPAKPLNNIKRAFATAVKAAKIERDGKAVRITPHTLRKAFATWLAMQGVPQRILQSLLGHTPGSKVTDQYYVMPQDDAKRAASISLPIVPEEQTEKNSQRKVATAVATGRAA